MYGGNCMYFFSGGRKGKKAKEMKFVIADEERLGIITDTELRDIIHSTEKDVIFLCIGSDRYIVDSLGPLVGTMLQENKSFSYHVYGTLDCPVHALNLEKTSKEINQQFPNSLLIAVDACIGEKKDVGKVIIEKGPLFPGKAMNKQLVEVGDYHIKAVVSYIDKRDPNHFFESLRLHTVMTMVQKVSSLIISCTTQQKERINPDKEHSS